MHILISGAGIAGLTLALCCQNAGLDCTVIEKADSVRGGGYMVDFFGPGYDAAQRLGLLPELEKIHYQMEGLRFRDAQGREKFSLSYPHLRALFDGRHFNFMRGDLARFLFSKVEGRVECRFSNTIVSVTQSSGGANAVLSDGSTIRADLVVGAGGFHSGVRALTFGEEGRFTRFLNAAAAAFVIENPPASLQTSRYFDTLTVPGRQVGVYPIRGGRIATFFAHRTETPPKNLTGEEAARELQRIYGDMGWIVPDLVRHIDPANLFYDAVSQIEVPQWSRGRVVLVGDAGYCVSLVAGQGASLAMAGAYILADELSAAGGDLERAAAQYEKRLRPPVEKKQLTGRKTARWFLPENQTMLWVRDLLMRTSGFGPARLLVKRALAPESVELSRKS